jgi:uncharacterized membrane protein
MSSAAALALVVAACDGGSGADCSKVVKFSEVKAFTNNCTSCHATTLEGANRQDAPADVNYDTYAEATKEPEEAIEQVEKGEMPPPEAAPLTDAEKEELVTWLKCGTPE